MDQQVIGILGGMGPEATLECFGKIIRFTPARKDQDHLRVVIDSNPKVPDRTAAIVGRGKSPMPALVASCRALERAGADFIIIPCVSAHFFLAQVQKAVKLPILSMFDAMAEAIRSGHPAIKKVGLLGTTGTIIGGLFQKRLASEGIQCLLPSEDSQSRIMDAIYDIKNSQAARSREAISSDLALAAESLIAKGAQGIIAGCTEIPIALRQEHLTVPYFDSLAILARAAIRRAGIQPLT